MSRPRIARILAAAVLSAFAAIGATTMPAQAGGPPPAADRPSADRLEHRSATVEIPADRLREQLRQITVIAPDGRKLSLAEVDPSCGADWLSLSLYVQWWYGSITRVTEAAAADWGGQAKCSGMSYMSATSHLYFRGPSVAQGSLNTCGISEGPGICGTVPTSGEWACGGIGNCDGNYHASIGTIRELPPGWSWGPAPVDCTVVWASMYCVTYTGTVYVPLLN